MNVYMAPLLLTDVERNGTAATNLRRSKKMKRILITLSSLIGALGLIGVAAADPVSLCTGGSSGPFVCDFYETDGTGAPSEISSVVTLPQGVQAGWVVIMESGDPLNPADQANRTLWSDLLHFIDGGFNLATTAQLFSIGCNIDATDISCFPSFADINDGHAAFLLEGGGPTTYVATPATYIIHSDPGTASPPPVIAPPGAGGAPPIVTAVPVPSTLLLFGSML